MNNEFWTNDLPNGHWRATGEFKGNSDDNIYCSVILSALATTQEDSTWILKRIREHIHHWEDDLIEKHRK